MLGKKSGNALAAFVSFAVSAIWHGFYPGFYSFFIGAFLLDYWNKLAQKALGSNNWCPEVIQNYSLTLFYWLYCSYFALAFFLLNFCDFHPVYMSMYYAGHLFPTLTIPIFLLLQPSK